MKKDSQKRLLVVEDDELFREAMCDILLEKYLVQEAGSSEEALKVLSKNTFDLIIVDINLPGINGIELLANIKSQGSLLPVIILTATEPSPKEVRLIKKNAFGCLSKPVDANHLLMTIDQALRPS